MSAETAGLTIGLKTGALAAVAVFAVSVLAIMMGFTVVPLTPGDELRDAARRICCGLMCAFTAGLLTTAKVLSWHPDLLPVLLDMFQGERVYAYVAAATPFFAAWAVLGFWVVAAVMAWFRKRQGKDIGELITDARSTVGGQP